MSYSVRKNKTKWLNCAVQSKKSDFCWCLWKLPRMVGSPPCATYSMWFQRKQLTSYRKWNSHYEEKNAMNLYAQYFFEIKVVMSAMFPLVQKCSPHVQNDNSDTQTLAIVPRRNWPNRFSHGQLNMLKHSINAFHFWLNYTHFPYCIRSLLTSWNTDFL